MSIICPCERVVDHLSLSLSLVAFVAYSAEGRALNHKSSKTSRWSANVKPCSHLCVTQGIRWISSRPSSDFHARTTLADRCHGSVPPLSYVLESTGMIYSMNPSRSRSRWQSVRAVLTLCDFINSGSCSSFFFCFWKRLTSIKLQGT